MHSALLYLAVAHQLQVLRFVMMPHLAEVFGVVVVVGRQQLRGGQILQRVMAFAVDDQLISGPVISTKSAVYASSVLCVSCGMGSTRMLKIWSWARASAFLR